MSSVLHPVGPEPRERYWVRRVAVLVAVVVVIGVVIALVGNAMSAGSAVQAEPAPPTVVVPTVPPTPSATPVASASPTPGATPTPGAPTPGAATPAAGSSASPTPTDTVTPDAGQTPKAERSTPPTASDTKKAAAEKAAQKKAAEQKKKKKAAVLASCPTGDVRTTMTGPRTVKAGKDVKLDLSVVNESTKTCFLKVTGDNFTLTVVSGKDRIWSSDDCAKAVPAQSRKLTAQKSVDWSMTWDGKRSAPGCRSRSESPKAGYYWAIASFDDAPEVRWRIILG